MLRVGTAGLAAASPEQPAATPLTARPPPDCRTACTWPTSPPTAARRPRLRTLQHFLRCRAFVKSIQDAHSFPDAEVACRHHVQPSQAEEEEHLRGPLADPPHRRQHRHDLLIGHASRRPQPHGAVRALGGQIADRPRLRRRQSGAPKRRVGQLQALFRTWKARPGGEGAAAPVDGARGGARELLMGDRAGDGLEVRPARQRPVGESGIGVETRQGRAEPRIAARERVQLLRVREGAAARHAGSRQRLSSDGIVTIGSTSAS